MTSTSSSPESAPGRMTGVGQVLRQEAPGHEDLASAPESLLLSEGKAAPTRSRASDPTWFPRSRPGNLGRATCHIKSDVTLRIAITLLLREGPLAFMLLAASAGQAPQLAGKTIVTVLPDTGDFFTLSTPRTELLRLRRSIPTAVSPE